MRLGYFPGLRRFHAPIAAFLILLLLVFIYRGSGSTYLGDDPAFAGNGGGSSQIDAPPGAPLQTLPELRIVIEEDPPAQPEPEFCVARFGPKYLEELRDHTIQYCEAFSPSASTASPSLTCFHSHTSENRDRDSFCITHGAVLNEAGKGFTLPCNIRAPTDDERERGIIQFGDLKRYWYQTGPAIIFENFFRFESNPAESPAPPAVNYDSPERPPFLVMIKREGEGNVWHCLMEIWAMTNSLDVLRMTPDPSRGGAAFFEAPGDVPNAQVVILDDKPYGPFFDLWKLLTGRDPIRFQKWAEKQQAAGPAVAQQPQNVIVPLPGGSNPQWQNDWTERDCHDAPTLKVFSRRVMNHYGIEPFPPRDGAPAKPRKKSAARRKGPREGALTLTFLDRRSTRRLVGSDDLVAAARKKFPDVSIESIDFATIPFPEQIRVVRETDLLVGVHGAGLTHTMFLPEGGVPGSGATSAAVVEILPEGMDYKGFRNMAVMMGHQYFATHAEVVPAGTKEAAAKKKKPSSPKQGDAAAKAENPDAAGADDADPAPNPSGDKHAAVSKRSLEKREDWHFADVRIGEDEFLELLQEAIEAIQ